MSTECYSLCAINLIGYIKREINPQLEHLGSFGNSMGKNAMEVPTVLYATSICRIRAHPLPFFPSIPILDITDKSQSFFAEQQELGRNQ